MRCRVSGMTVSAATPDALVTVSAVAFPGVALTVRVVVPNRVL